MNRLSWADLEVAEPGKAPSIRSRVSGKLHTAVGARTLGTWHLKDFSRMYFGSTGPKTCRLACSLLNSMYRPPHNPKEPKPRAE